MLNSNQRRFRKEMIKAQKEADWKKANPYYSYVEDRVITDYYSGPSKKKARGFLSAATRWLLSLVVCGLIVIGAVKYVSSQPANLDRVQAAELLPTVSQEASSEQQAVFDYLSSFDSSAAELQNMMNYAVTALPKKVRRDPEYEANLKQYLERLREWVEELSGRQVPPAVVKLHDTKIQVFSVHHEQLTYLLSSVENKNPALVQNYNVLNEKVKLLNTQSRSEMIRAITSAGMTYRLLDDGTIAYRMTK